MLRGLRQLSSSTFWRVMVFQTQQEIWRMLVLKWYQLRDVIVINALRDTYLIIFNSELKHFSFCWLQQSRHIFDKVQSLQRTWLLVALLKCDVRSIQIEKVHIRKRKLNLSAGPPLWWNSKSTGSLEEVTSDDFKSRAYSLQVIS